jgi:stage III sporulation protein AD
MIKVAGIALCILFSSLLIKSYNKAFATILSISGAILLFLTVSDKIGDVISVLNDLSSSVSISISYIKLMIKVLGITLIAQFVSDVCRDNGENAIASITEISAKIIVISLVLPLFESVIEIVTGLVK